MNRNWLKIAATITMLIDHIGAFLFPEVLALKIIGRLSFPIFAFFIAEGWKHTSNKSKYALMLLLCAVISQIPYALITSWYKLNIIFTFLLAILIIYLIESYKKHEIPNMIGLLLVSLFLLFTEILGVVDYGIFGVALIVLLYFVKDRKLRLFVAMLVLVLLTLKNAAIFGFSQGNLIQFTSIIGIVLLFFYNGGKGNLNLKYLFYTFYPAHLLIIYLIRLFCLG